MPRVSIVLNCFNHACYVGEAVESVLGQTFADLELIAIDNGSTDDSRERLRSYGSDPRVRLMLHDANRSVSQRLNEGIGVARGEFVSVLYSDDWYLPERIEKQIELFDSLPDDYGVIYGPTWGHHEQTGEQWLRGSFTHTGWILDEILAPRRRDRVEIDMCNPLVRRQCYLRHRFYEDVFGEGEAIFFRIALTHRFAYLDEPLTVLRDHGGNAGKALVRNCAGWRTCVERLREHPDLPAEKRPLVGRYEASVLTMYGWAGVRVGADPAWARECLLAAVRLAPREALAPRLVAGLLLALLPSRAREVVNRAGHAAKHSPGNQVFVEEWEGL